MTDTPAIHTALAAVMEDCKAVAKRDRNEHQRFLFRGIDAVVNAVGPVLRKHGVTVRPVVQSVTYDNVLTSTGKPATACRVIVDYVFGAGDGSELTATVAAEAWDNGDKAAPKAMSVAFRTALLQTLALPTDEPDPDAHTYERAPADPVRQARHDARRESRRAQPQQDTGEAITANTRAALFALMGQLVGTDEDQQRAFLTDTLGREVESRASLTEAEGRLAGQRLRAWGNGDDGAAWTGGPA